DTSDFFTRHHSLKSVTTHSCNTALSSCSVGLKLYRKLILVLKSLQKLYKWYFGISFNITDAGPLA
ncbi:MAG: hypothetical protein ACFFDE_11335, partial [Promethearchaeota archaeon]